MKSSKTKQNKKKFILNLFIDSVSISVGYRTGHTPVCGTIPNSPFSDEEEKEEENASCEIQHINSLKAIVEIGFRDGKK